MLRPPRFTIRPARRSTAACYRAVMPCTRRSTWPDERDDYVIRCEGLDVGRVYLTRVPAGDRWLWTVFINGHVPQVEGRADHGAGGDAR